MPAWTESIITEAKRFLFARTSLEGQLYPPPRLPLRFRPYEPADFAACCEIYSKNAPGRFPEGHIVRFESYLHREEKTFLIAEHDSKIVGCGGLDFTGPDTAILCYGLVDPQFQRQRVGAMLALLRIAQLAPRPQGYYVFIFALESSIRVYRKFGFVRYGRWQAEDGKEYPLAVLPVPGSSIEKIRSTLRNRHVRIDGRLPLNQSESSIIEVRPERWGKVSFLFQKRVGAPAAAGRTDQPAAQTSAKPGHPPE